MRSRSYVHRRFEAQAARTPHAEAVVFPGQGGARRRLSYADLNRRANQLARSLRRRGVGPEVVVALRAEPSVELAIGLLGILKAGGTYLPIAPEMPPERLAFLLDDARPALMLLATTLDQPSNLPTFQPSNLPTLNVVADWPDIAHERGDDLAANLAPDSLAYVIYTSGSTGTPKGVQVTHRALANHCEAIEWTYALEAGERVLQFAALSFDVAAEELFPTWARGGTVVARPGGAPPSFAELRRLVERERLSVLNLPTAYWHAWVDDLERSKAPLPDTLRLVVLGTEQARAASLKRWRELAGDRVRCVNAYGLTETTITTTTYDASMAELPGGASVPIGRPISHTTAYVLDERLVAVPRGDAGELYIGGLGVARGYLNQAALTAERFLPDPFGDRGARMYRTGDLARVLPDGNIEFLGRADQQIKLRGFRVEPGEIEHALRGHSLVREALVVPYAAAGEQRLAAYVVPRRADESAAERQPDQWRAVYDELYDLPAVAHDPTFNIAGWNSSYTGQPIAAEEMREWVDHTVERIRALRPRRVLEIGCGTGLLLFRIAPHCERYVGFDISPEAIRGLDAELTRHQLPHVSLLARAADDLADIEPGAFDLVVINSVTQHFPDAAYLVRVLAGAARAVAPGGQIFVGDVRSLPLLRAFHASVQLYRADAGLSLAQLHRQVWRRIAREEELTVAPALFHALPRQIPRVAVVDVQLKRGRFQNEMTRFRYDVVLRLDAGAAADVGAWLDWRGDRLTLAELRGMLAELPPALGVRGVPNARLVADLAAAELLERADGLATAGALREATTGAGIGMDPEAFWELGAELGYAASVTWSEVGAIGDFDVVFRHIGNSSKNSTDKTDWERISRRSSLSPQSALQSVLSIEVSSCPYTNDPPLARFARAAVPELRRYLADRLPEYMIPSAFVPLGELPLTASGKVDRRALPRPELGEGDAASEYAPPVLRTPVEARLIEIWTDLLDMVEIGVEDSFFALGGHSLLAVQLVSRVRDAFGVDLPLRALFEMPEAATVSGLAEQIETLRWVARPERDGDAEHGREEGEL